MITVKNKTIVIQIFSNPIIMRIMIIFRKNGRIFQERVSESVSIDQTHFLILLINDPVKLSEKN
jgi:hypothetical protein